MYCNNTDFVVCSKYTSECLTQRCCGANFYYDLKILESLVATLNSMQPCNHQATVRSAANPGRVHKRLRGEKLFLNQEYILCISFFGKP